MMMVMMMMMGFLPLRVCAIDSEIWIKKPNGKGLFFLPLRTLLSRFPGLCIVCLCAYMYSLKHLQPFADVCVFFEPRVLPVHLLHVVRVNAAHRQNLKKSTKYMYAIFLNFSTLSTGRSETLGICCFRIRRGVSLFFLFFH